MFSFLTESVSFLTVAVVLTALAGQGSVAMGTATLRLLAFSQASHTLAFLTHIQWVQKSLSIHENPVFEEAIFEKEAN